MKLAPVQLGAAAAAMLLAMTTPSHAYLDPGSASMALQAIVAALAAGGATTAIYWNRLKTLFAGRKADSEQSKDK